jgi:TolB-like protein
MVEFLARIRSGAPRQKPIEPPAPGQMSVAEAVTRPDAPLGTEIRPSSVRLGIREMRMIGTGVDRALAAGLAEELMIALSRFRWISCVSGGLLVGNAGDQNPGWSETGLDLVLDGTIQGGGDHIRITVRLLDLRAGGAVIWANRFDYTAGDTLTMQDGVAAAIVAQIDPVLLMREGELAAARVPRGATPRELVLRAVPAIYRLDRMSFHAAGELLEAALRAEPGNIDALAWFAYWHLFLVGQGWAGDPEAAINRAGVLADSAVAMDPNDARALTLAGHVRGFLMKRAPEAAVLHDRAISLNPNLALAWCFSGFALSYMGDQETALARMTQAIQLSPSDPHLFFFQAAIVMPHLLRGDYQEAAAAGRKAVELNPWFSSSFKGYLAALGHLGCTKDAANVMARLLKLEPGFTVRDAIRRSPMGLPKDVERYAEGLRLAGLPER